MSLLDILARMGAGLNLVVAHVDHGLSEASEQIASDVAGHAARRGYDVHVARARDLAGPNLQARARDFRYAFFQSIAREVSADAVATGHTLDDRVETTLARLIRGAGTDILAGILPVDGVPPRIRPLIAMRRSETRRYCDEAAVEYFDDPANADLRFDRAAVRASVVAAIEERWGDGAVRAMATSAARLAEDSGALREIADRLYADLARSGPPAADTSGEAFPEPPPERTPSSTITFDLQSVLALPRALRRRLLERAVGRVRDRAAGIDAVLDALERSDRKVPARFSLPEGRTIEIGPTHLTCETP